LNKKNFIVILILLAAALTMACSCLPLSALEKFFDIGQPVGQPTLDSPSDNDPVQPVGSCSDELANLLWKAEDYDVPGTELPMEYTLATYEVFGNSITSPDLPTVPKNIRSYQQDSRRHHEIWDLIVDVVPMEYRSEVAYFMVFTDGPGGLLGAVEQTDDPNTWIFEMDAQDAANFPDLSTTLIHEVCHIFTLNTSQVATDYDVFNHPEDEYAYEQGDADCDTYFMFEGCSYPESYINLFFQSYWQEIYPRWLEINAEQDEQTLENLLYDFYGQHPDQFVSTYAATSPEEDIAESFMYFVLSPQPAGDTIAEDKILFFYDFPELVSLRDQMRLNLCPFISQ
jgi:hypothetical protein